MAKALSLDLRIRVLAALDKGLTFREAADLFDVSIGSLVKWRRLVREQGDPRPRPAGGDRRSARIEAARDTILGILEENPKLTIGELREALEARGLVFGWGAVWNFLKRHGIALRKRGRPSSRRSGTAAAR